MSTKRQQARQNANERATVKTEQKTRQSAAAERNAELDAVRERAERLKALRLEHEARVRQHLRSVKSAPKRAGSRATSKRQTKEAEKKVTLADWLAQQRYFGRET